LVSGSGIRSTPTDHYPVFGGPPPGGDVSGLRITRIDHVSVLVTDLARARAFYAGVLGLREVAKPKTFDFVALWFDLGGGQTLHLLQKPQPDARSPRHFALGVPDARAAREHFRASGVPIQETGPIPHCDRFFVSDPDGNRIELIHWLEPYDPAASGADRLD
jgi:catechol 2,3-dioxygenase-like lactoylglutathione lyase family enzyme